MAILPSEITDFDVLCGKSKMCLQAKGSKAFRDIIDTYMPRYTKCQTKYSKMVITKEIYEVVSQKARFLKLNEADQIWEEISPMAARDKIGHSLRFSSRAKRRHTNKNTTTTTKGGTKTHKRSGSFSSTSSSGSENSNPTRDSLVGLLQESFFRPEEQPSSSIMEPLTLPSSSSASTTNGADLDQFLDLELRFDNGDDTTSSANAYTSLDNLELLMQNDAAADPLDNFMDDILNVVKSIEKESCSTTEEEQSLMTLLSEPVGEWDEDRAIVLESR